MGGQPQDSLESSRSISSQSSPAMVREIYEHSQALRETIHRNVEGRNIFAAAPQSIDSVFSGIRKIIIAASGSSRNAGLAGEIMMEDLAGVPVDVEYSSEYCLRSSHADADSLVVPQSGETADTIAAQREALRRGAKTVAISNVAESTIARESSATVVTYAAPECAVPATKSFTAQVAILFVPVAPELLLPILEIVPLQLLAYHFATLNGCDVDHPRHLVKAVVRE
jgi:glucosamine--fructose-6-phosphate aminotransferase (isomerizing)